MKIEKWYIFGTASKIFVYVCCKLLGNLKVLSSEMDPAEIKFIR